MRVAVRSFVEGAVEPGCRGRHCADGTCDVCKAVPDAAWIAWKKIAHAPGARRARPAERRQQLARVEARIALKADALALVEQLALYWIAELGGCDEPGSAKEAYDLLIKHGYTLNSTRTLLYRPNGSEVVR